jgi:hypothetical protein
MKKILEVFKGDKGEWSSKRFVGIIGALILFCTLIYSTVNPKKLPPAEDLVSAVEWITILALGFTSIDKFSVNKQNDEE